MEYGMRAIRVAERETRQKERRRLAMRQGKVWTLVAERGVQYTMTIGSDPTLLEREITVGG